MEFKLSIVKGLSPYIHLHFYIITFIRFYKHVTPKHKVRRGDSTGIVCPTSTTTT